MNLYSGGAFEIHALKSEHLLFAYSAMRIYLYAILVWLIIIS